MMDVYAPCYVRTDARRVELKFIIRASFRLKKNIDTVAIFGRRTQTIWFLTVGHLNPSKSSVQHNRLFIYFFKKIFYSKSPRWDLMRAGS
jgi:hypothetical protein